MRGGESSYSSNAYGQPGLNPRGGNSTQLSPGGSLDGPIITCYSPGSALAGSWDWEWDVGVINLWFPCQATSLPSVSIS